MDGCYTLCFCNWWPKYGVGDWWKTFLKCANVCFGLLWFARGNWIASASFLFFWSRREVDDWNEINGRSLLSLGFTQSLRFTRAAWSLIYSLVWAFSIWSRNGSWGFGRRAGEEGVLAFLSSWKSNLNFMFKHLLHLITVNIRTLRELIRIVIAHVLRKWLDSDTDITQTCWAVRSQIIYLTFIWVDWWGFSKCQVKVKDGKYGCISVVFFPPLWICFAYRIGTLYHHCTFFLSFFFWFCFHLTVCFIKPITDLTSHCKQSASPTGKQLPCFHGY